ncbi:complement C1q tumor necrosis factor-related protein 3-like [Mytilus edulis]|uniref:complement C1q tumor necrosis factor-related protein 3-like n=1 Tax=Mytilus edulis TaxID=6550 RepID=UPI0039F125B9
MVTGHKSCSRNAGLMKSIQYQLKLVEDNDEKCDCARRVSEPGKVAFMAKNSDSLVNIPGKSAVVYNTVMTNLGNGYDKSTGTFTAPSNGVYNFSWTVVTHFGKYFFTYLALNGKLIARNYTGGRVGSEHISSTQKAVLEIKKDDKVFVKVQDDLIGQFMLGDSWSTFSGYKL